MKKHTAKFIEQQIEKLLAKLTLDEKLCLIRGRTDFNTGDVPRLGIEGIRTSDGPQGVRLEDGRTTTALPCGEMDFKVAGTKKGITAIQMDLKNDGLKHEIVKEAFAITQEARLQILDEILLKAIPEPRHELAKTAPKMIQMQINPDKIREVIGSGGKVIQKITADTGCKIDIDDDGTIYIASKDIDACRAARATIEDIVFEPEAGTIYEGKVVRIISNLGAFIELKPGKDAMCHIKDLEFKRTEKVEDVLNVGDVTPVKFLGIDEKGRWNVSRKEALKALGLDKK